MRSLNFLGALIGLQFEMHVDLKVRSDFGPNKTNHLVSEREDRDRRQKRKQG